MKNSKIKEIHDLLLAYAAGEYHRQGKVSEDRDEIDMIIAGVNMLGEELLTTTVSRDFFSSIYDSVADMVFVVSPKGVIQDINKAVDNILNYQRGSLITVPINNLIKPGEKSFFNQVKRNLKSGEKSHILETFFLTSNKGMIPVSCTCSKIIDKNNKFKGYLIISEDITQRNKSEKLILRTIVDTQEKEQKRVAEDLHDSLGQELSTVKLLLSAIGESLLSSDDKYKEAYETCKSLLDSSIVNLRSICFDLMPASLENGGIHLALGELADRLNKQSAISFKYSCRTKLSAMEKALEIVIYRIAQEFINNSIKHANATKVTIILSGNATGVSLSIKDNGKGFHSSSKSNISGRGLNTMNSRVKAFNGSMKLRSKPGKGTQLQITFPYQA